MLETLLLAMRGLSMDCDPAEASWCAGSVVNSAELGPVNLNKMEGGGSGNAVRFLLRRRLLQLYLSFIASFFFFFVISALLILAVSPRYDVHA